MLETRTLFFILLGLFLIVSLGGTFLLRGQSVDNTPAGIIENQDVCAKNCGNDVLCLESCKSALLNQASVSGDAGKCSGLSDEEEKICVERIQFNSALSSGNVENCNGLSFAQNCKDLILYNKMLVSNDKGICSGISDEKMRGKCEEV